MYARIMGLLILFLVSVDASAYREITFEELVNDLPKHPIRVGFDIDDTILDPSSIFFHMKYSEESKQRYGVTEDGTAAYDNNPLAGCDLSVKYGLYSFPKYIGLKLVELHAERGDDIYFITARPHCEGETLSQRIYEIFPEYRERIKEIVFAGYYNENNKRINIKQQKMKEANLDRYYGDSDEDMRATVENGVKPIRVLQGMLECCHRIENHGAHPGLYDEDVLLDSDY